MTFQLRMYRVKDGAMEQWLQEWQDGVLPARRAYGFSVLGPWIVRDESRFVWIVGHDGDFEAADKAYYDSPERAALDPPPSSMPPAGTSQPHVSVMKRCRQSRSTRSSASSITTAAASRGMRTTWWSKRGPLGSSMSARASETQSLR